MKRSRQKRAAIISILLLALLIAAPLAFTWRAVRQERLNQALILAMKGNDDKAVVSLLNQGADANCRDEPPRKFSLWQTLLQVVRGRKSQASHAPTPLLIVLEPAYRDAHVLYPPENVPLIRALLDYGAHVNQADDDGGTPLVWAIQGGKNATVRLLLASGASVSNQGSADHLAAPLVLAADQGTIDIGVITDMLDRGANVNQRDTAGNTALTLATVNRRVGVVRLLLARHADSTLSGNDGQTALATASWESSPQSRQIVRLLKLSGAKK